MSCLYSIHVLMFICLSMKENPKKNNFQTLENIVMARHKLTLQQTPKPTPSLLNVCSRSGRGLLFKTLCLIWVRLGSATDLLAVRSWGQIYECETNLGLFLLTACRPTLIYSKYAIRYLWSFSVAIVQFMHSLDNKIKDVNCKTRVSLFYNYY